MATRRRSPRLAGLGAHLGRHGDLDELEILGGLRLLMRRAARDHDAVAGAEALLLAAGEFEIDPASEDVDELHLAGVVVPAGRALHRRFRRGHLRAHAALRRRGHAEIAILEEGTP